MRDHVGWPAVELGGHEPTAFHNVLELPAQPAWMAAATRLWIEEKHPWQSATLTSCQARDAGNEAVDPSRG